jgi:hypothetical protein
MDKNDDAVDRKRRNMLIAFAANSMLCTQDAGLMRVRGEQHHLLLPESLKSRISFKHVSVDRKSELF